MDDRRFGLVIRALRRRLGWRQVDLAERAFVSQQTISEIERGRIVDKSVETLRRVGGVLDARVDVGLGWRGGAVDRLVDQRHAELVEWVIAILKRYGWEVQPEVSFSHYGDRGSIDVLAWKSDLLAIVIVEVKSEVTSTEETHRRLDVKERIAPGLIRERFGWLPGSVATLLVLPESSTSRRVVARYGATFATRFPDPGKGIRQWLRRPSGHMAAIWFLSPTGGVSDRRGRGGATRVRRPQNPPEPDPQP